MAVRAMILSALAAFGLGMLGLGAVFKEPGGDGLPRHRQASPVVAASESGERWLMTELLPPGPTPTAVGPSPPEPVIAPPLEAIPDDYVAPVAVWSTAAEWSPED